MDSATLRAFDRQMRRDLAPADTGDVVERDGASVRVIGGDPDGWSGVVWSNADESTADALIAREVARFATLSRRWEWKYYAHDRPGDLPRRLLAAGFEAQPAEAVLIAETSRVPTGVVLPPGVRLVPLTLPRLKAGDSWFSNGCLPALRAGWSHTISAGEHRQPGGSEVDR